MAAARFKKSKIKNYKFGFFAEYFSILFLFFKGYIPLRHRYVSNFGEIDLILKSMFSKTLIFLEVKARKNKENKDVLSNLQKHRISKSASFFIAKNKQYLNHTIRFDLIIFHNIISLEHIKNSWFADDI